MASSNKDTDSMTEQQPTDIRKLVQTPATTAYRIASAADIDWHGETDVAVIGYGAAGACAALEAGAQGVQVTVLERLNGGGASALSGGVIYAGGGTELQRQAEVKDSIDNMIDYLRLETAGVIPEHTLRDFCRQSIANLEWLQQHGVPFDSTSYDEKTSYPPNGYFLYYSGNEVVYPYNSKAAPARRGHRVKGEGFTGRILFRSLNQAALRRNNIQIQCHCEARRLIVDRHNRVLGVEYLQAPINAPVRGLMVLINSLANKFAVLEPSTGTLIRKLVHLLRRCGTVRRLRVNNGVILSAGGFIYNRRLLAQLAPAYKPARPLGEDCIGLGICLGVGAGAQVEHMEKVSAWRFYAPPNCVLKGIIVNEKGQRICNEDLYGATAADRVLADNGERAYLILDKTMMANARSEARFSNMALFQWAPAQLFFSLSSTRGATLRQLADKCQIDATELQRTVDDYNNDANNGRDKLGKAAEFLQAIDQGPFYALDISLQNRRVPCFAITLGGLQVDQSTGAVLDTQNSPIDGLYAAGRNAVGVCSNAYVSGLSLADCVFSGRRAGRNAALASQ